MSRFRTLFLCHALKEEVGAKYAYRGHKEGEADAGHDVPTARAVHTLKATPRALDRQSDPRSPGGIEKIVEEEREGEDI